MLATLFAAVLCAPAGAAGLTATVTDAKGAPVEGAVVYVREAPGSFAASTAPLVMDQVDLDFMPALLVVPAGAKVVFPNKDEVHHQIYSVSPAKKFELPLYKGKPADPVVFETTGVVKLGCNIHDWMSGVVLVLQNPYFARTGKDGKAKLAGLPDAPGLELAVYHTRLRGEPDKTAKALKGPAMSWTLDLRPDAKKKRPAANPYGGGYGSNEP